MKNLEELARSTPNGDQILSECRHVAETLLRKNASYGDSALNSVRVFSKADSVEQIRVRIDDKLSRLANTRHRPVGERGEDTTLDLIGYLILLRIAERQPGGEKTDSGEPAGPDAHVVAGTGGQVRGSMTVVEVDEEPETP